MSTRIKIRRGTESTLPELAVGELGVATDTANLWVGTSSGNVLLNDRGAIDDTTNESLILRVNPSSGSDPVTTTRFNTQAEVDAHGVFATIKNAVESLPPRIHHKVEIRIADGSWTITDWGSWNRFTLDIARGGRFVIRSESLFKELTDDLSVSSFSGRTLTLDSDPGFSDDQYVNKLLRIKSGTNAAEDTNLVWVRSHSGTSWTTHLWTNEPDSTSVVRVIEPAASIDLGDSDLSIMMGVPHSQHTDSFPNANFPVEILGLDLYGTGMKSFTNTFISFPYSSLRGFRPNFVDCLLSTNGMLFDGEDVDYFSQVGGFARSGVNTDHDASGYVIRRSTFGYFITGSASRTRAFAFMFNESLDSSGYGFFIRQCILEHGGHTDTVGSIDNSMFFAEKDTSLRLSPTPSSRYVSGSGGDISLDGTAYTYNDLENDADNFISENQGSHVYIE